MSLTRRAALGMIAAAGLARPVAAQSRLSYELVPVQVAPGVWMIEGSTDYFSMQNGGAIVNITLLQGDDGLIAIDTGPSRRYGEALSDVARRIDLRGITTVVNTHHHPDHFFGNQVFADRPSFALGATQSAAFAEGEGFSDNMYRLLGDWMRGTEVVPPRNVLSGGEVIIGGRRMLALPLGGHTVADLALLDHDSGLLVTGDLVFFDRAPTTPSADLDRWRASLRDLASLDMRGVIPGHGPLDIEGRAIAQTADYLDWLDSGLRAAAREGLDMVEVMDLPLPPRFAGMGAQPQEYHRTVSHLFAEIERQELPRGN